jgi:acyl transferase domain-containing protein/phosphopantetheinyl transferase
MAGGLELVFTANQVLAGLLGALGIVPDVVLGHSYGEYSALVAGGALAVEPGLSGGLARVGEILERRLVVADRPAQALLAAGTDRRNAEAVIRAVGGGLELAMDNCRHQVVLAGPEAAVERAALWLRERGVICHDLPFDLAYHTTSFGDLVADAIDAVVGPLALAPPVREVYSCTTARPYPRDPAAARDLVRRLSSRTVEFTAAIEALYAADVRIFVEAGPKGNLTAFVSDVLRGRPHLALAADVPRRGGLVQLQHVLAALAAHGLPLNLAPLYRHREPQPVPLEATAPRSAGRSPTTVELPLATPALGLGAEGCVLSRPAGLPDPRSGAPGGADARSASPPPPSPTSQALEDHLRTMQRFLAVQERVMDAFLAARRRPDVAALPFVDAIDAFEPGRRVTVRRRLDPDDDLFLRDHGLVERVSDADPSLCPRLTVPLTILIEMMAEAAALLFPGQVVVAVRDVRARRWLDATAPVTVTVSAQHAGPRPEATVEIHRVDDLPEAGPLATGTVVAAPAYPAPPPAGPLTLAEAAPSAHSAAELYASKRMFHGPRWQAVAVIEALGANGIIGELDRPRVRDLFRARPGSRLLTDAVLLDGAGQLLGYWAVERVPGCEALMPMSVGVLELYGPPTPGRTRCEVEVLDVSDATVRATLTLFGADGRVHARLVDWQDRAFALPAHVVAFLRSPQVTMLSTPWELPLADPKPAPDDTLACQRLAVPPFLASSALGRDLMLLVLSRSERADLDGASWPDARKTEWLLGRIAVKDAVRRLLARRHGLTAVWPADVEVRGDARGAPVVRLLAGPPGLEPPAVAVSHAGGTVVALAVYASDGQRPGIDVEPLAARPAAFEDLAFTPAERGILETLPPASRQEWATRLWCAKEAAGKALGSGLPDGPRALVVRAIEPENGRVDVETPDGRRLVADTGRDRDLVVAVTLGTGRTA